MRDVRRQRLERRIGEQRLHDSPIALVLAREGQAGAPVIGLIAEVQLVEPIARVKAVAVHIFGAQQIVPGMEEGQALSQSDQAGRKYLASRAGMDVVTRRRL